MTTPSPTSSSETALQKEWLLFREIFDLLLDRLLNSFFDLRPEKAQRRTRILIFLLLVSGFLITILHYPLILWAQRLQEAFLYLLNPGYAKSYTNSDSFINFFILANQAIADARILQYLLIILVTFLLTRQLAAIYLADIFELNDVSMASKFISEVALMGSDETIRISQGDIAEQHLESLKYLIGGPGKVIVDIDSVALFERADGTPHVIGPTGKEPGAQATIEGFERFLSAIYIRDQWVELSDQSDKTPSVMSRSRDGIPISATDVHLMFSIYRGDNVKPTSEIPFPFSKEAVENIVYKSSSWVTPDQAYPSAYSFFWINNMIGLVRGGLSRFMSARDLIEYLPHIGSRSRSPNSTPEFTPRRKITGLFSQFAEEFAKRARNNGVELHWIGVGTWQLLPIISEVHLEAWKLSQKNLENGSEDAMKNVEDEAFLRKMEVLIKNIPIGAYYDILDMKRQNSKRELGKMQEIESKDNEDGEILLFDEEEILKTLDGAKFNIDDLKILLNEKIEASVAKRIRNFAAVPSHQERITKLLVEYRKQLLEALQFMKTKNEPIKPVVEDAIGYIDSQMASDND